jgi:predicted nucleic acid-binding protein
MIILDTDVLSAIMSPRPIHPVVAWLDRQARMSVWTTAITVMEVRFGIALLPRSARQDALQAAFERLLAEKIESRIAPFDTSAAEQTALLMAERRRSGRTIEVHDSMIAGITIARHAILATRNTRHFAHLAVAVVDPWTA